MTNKLVYALFLASLISKNVSAQSSGKNQVTTDDKKVVQNTILIDTVKKQDAVKDITEKVVEATYKNYPQQSGQPTIIINNIIVPPDYNKQPQNKANRTSRDLRDDEDYQTWLRERKLQKESVTERSNSEIGFQKNNFDTDKKNVTFQQRFGERPARNSGIRIIPVVGVHASVLGSDENKNHESGRTGWNAGVDVRMRMKRFFIQPGLHYLNSSMTLTDKDSVAHTKFFDGPRIHSLKLPFLLGVYLTKANSGFFKLNVKAGVVGNYILAVDKNNQAQFTKENINGYSYGLNGGIGLEFGLISLDFNYEGGITKYFKDSNTKNNMLRITLGFKI